MAAIFRITDPPEQAKAATPSGEQLRLMKYAPRADKAYTVAQDGSRLVCYPATQPPSFGALIECAKERGRRETYVTRCMGVVDETGAAGNAAADPQAATLAMTSSATTAMAHTTRQKGHKLSAHPVVERLLHEIIAAAVARHNTMVVYRAGQHGSPTDKFFAQLAGDLVGALTPTAEHALQIVADEIAKEKQMQRLMASAEGGDRGGKGPGASGAATGAAPSPAAAQAGVLKIPERPGGAPSTPGGRGRRGGGNERMYSDFSPRLRAALARSATSPTLRGISPKRPDTARGRASHTGQHSSRFSVLSSSYDGVLDPPPLPSEGIAVRLFKSRPTTAESGLQGLSDTIGRRGTITLQGAADADGSGRHAGESDQPPKAAASLLRRKSSIRLLEALSQQSDDGPVVIKNNGWGSGEQGAMRVIEFGGASNFLCLPGTPSFETLIRHLTIDFWMRTDAKARDGKMCLLHVGEGHRHEVGMQLSLTMNWYSDATESLRLYIRDTGNRVMELIIALDNPQLTDGTDFHHYVVSIRNLEEGAVTVKIDGRNVERLRFLQTEHPNTFNPWVHRLYVGGVVDESDAVQHSFRGSLLDVRFVHSASGNVVVRWPLIPAELAANHAGSARVSDGASLGLVEVMRTVGAESVVTAHNVTIAHAAVPRVTPHFDGSSLVVNVGPLGPFGDFLHHWEFECRFRTTNTTQSMSLLGCTDSQHKMTEFGVVLNAEPTMGQSKERHRHHEKHVTFYIVDCAGKCLSALMRGGDRQHVMDGQWHTIQWRVVDTEANRMEVRIDGRTQDLMFVLREGPKAFTELRDWVAIGGHAVRSWKVKQLFDGYISCATLTLRGEKFMQLTLNEGPGGVVAVDHSGRHNHGLYFDPVTLSHRSPHDVVWELAKDRKAAGGEGVSRFDDGAAAALDDKPEEEEVSVVLHKNNRVSFALLQVIADPVGDGAAMREVIRDLLHRHKGDQDAPAVQLEVKPLEKALNRNLAGVLSAGHQAAANVLHALPESCFDAVESMLVLRESVAHVLREVEQRRAECPGHVLLVLRVGDAHISLLGLAGPFLPPDAIFDTNMLKWKSSVSTFGKDHKRFNVLNSTIHAVDRVFLECTSNPNLLRRIAAQPMAVDATATRAAGVVATSAKAPIVEQIQASGLPHQLAALVFSLLVDAEYSSSVHNIWSLWSSCREDEAAHAVLFQEALLRTARPRAAVMVQRNWRGRQARVRVQELEALRKIKQDRVDQIQAQRSINPHVLPKKKLKALVVTIFDFACPRIPSIASHAAVDVIAALEKQGYQITHVKNPTKGQLISAVHQAVDDQQMNFVYIAGYGGSVRLQPPPQPALDTLALALEEENEREKAVMVFSAKWRKLRMDFLVRRNALLAPSEQQSGAKVGGAVGGKGAAAKSGAAAAAAAPATAAKPPALSKKQMALQLQQQRVAAEYLKSVTDDLMKAEVEARVVEILRPYESEANMLVAEFRKALLVLEQFESLRDRDRSSAADALRVRTPSSRKGGLAASLVFQQSVIIPADTPRVEPYPSDVVSAEDIIASALQTNMANLGFQCVVAVDLCPLIPGSCGAGLLCASTTHSFAFPYKPDQRDVLSSQLRKALLGYPPQLPIRNLDAMLLGAVPCGESARDWRSFAQYVCTNVAKQSAADERLVLEELQREVDYTGDLVPIRRIVVDGEAKEKQRRDRDMKRVGCSCIFGVDASVVTSDMLAEFKALVHNVNISDVQQLPQALVRLDDDNHFIDLVDPDSLEGEVAKSVAPGVVAETALTAQGVLIRLTGDERSKIAATLHALAQRSAVWKVNVKRQKRATATVATEYFYAVRGTTSVRRFRQLEKQRCLAPHPAHSIRFVECSLE